ncbi:MAG: bifunctional serine/threonine-protein kinase/formylglycine-generating enzyme family protein [Simkaniaceae bacterium]
MEKKLLGDYTIIKQIGQGPLGAVFLAEHRFIKKHFVLKILPEELSTDRGFISRFEKQVASLSQLDHPHIVRVHNVSYSDGLYFLVTDCIVDNMGETINLTHYLSQNERRLPESEVFEILKQVASALDYAHMKQLDGKPLVHRGLKLNNILIGKGGEGLKIHLSDFGLSAIIGEGIILTKTYQILSQTLSVELGKKELYPKENPHTSSSKLHAAFLQHYAFLAPEQKEAGRIDQVDTKADSWAFGILTYFLLMRTFPEGYFPLPSKFMTDFTHNWDDLIAKCLDPDPLKRPSNLQDLLKKTPLIEKTAAPESSSAPVAEKSSFYAFAAQQSQSTGAKEQPKPMLPNASVGLLEKAEEKAASVMESIPSFFKVTRPQSEIENNKEPKPIIKPPEISRPTYEPDPGKVFQIDSTVAPYKPVEKEIKEVEPILTEMSIIEGGEYYRGSNEGVRDERPMHKVYISNFALDIHPVTNEQFVRFLEAMGGEKDSQNNDIIRLRESRIKRIGGKLIIESGYSKHPIVGVTWYGAVAYAKWVGKRLPTEAEWEIAARSGQFDHLFPTGENIDRTQANFFSADTTAVMSYPANRFDLFDIGGNVYEWCQDWYDYHYYESSSQEPEDPRGPIQGVYRVLRGGCWKSLKDDLRTSHRHRNNPGTVNKTYGFRCAADVT